MVLAAISDSDVFQVLYPLLMVPLSTWYAARHTERRVSWEPASPETPEHHDHRVRTSPHEGRAVHYHIYAQRQSASGYRRPSATNDEDWWISVLLLLCGGLVVIYVLARGYAAARDTLVDILLLGGVLSIGLTIGTYLGLRGLRTFTRARRAGLIVAAVAQAVCMANAYLLMHPSWTQGSYERTFALFLKSSRTLASSLGEQRDATFFLAYQGLGAVMAVLTLIATVLCALAVSGDVERDADVYVGRLRRCAGWALNAPGGGIAVAWSALVIATISATFCSGFLYNQIDRNVQQSREAPPVISAIDVTRRSEAVTVRFDLNEPATVRMRLLRLHGGASPSTVHSRVKTLRPGRRRLTITTARHGGLALHRGRYRIELVATRGAAQSLPKTTTLRVK